MPNPITRSGLFLQDHITISNLVYELNEVLRKAENLQRAKEKLASGAIKDEVAIYIHEVNIRNIEKELSTRYGLALEWVVGLKDELQVPTVEDFKADAEIPNI